MVTLEGTDHKVREGCWGGVQKDSKPCPPPQREQRGTQWFRAEGSGPIQPAGPGWRVLVLGWGPLVLKLQPGRPSLQE